MKSNKPIPTFDIYKTCLLYTSDAADERSSVDLGGRRIIKKKKEKEKEKGKGPVKDESDATKTKNMGEG